ncbi:MAG TPA: hypothetical protein VIT23_15995 [Terrimicrobiaceae bacterium]
MPRGTSSTILDLVPATVPGAAIIVSGDADRTVGKKISSPTFIEMHPPRCGINLNDPGKIP